MTPSETHFGPAESRGGLRFWPVYLGWRMRPAGWITERLPDPRTGAPSFAVVAADGGDVHTAEDLDSAKRLAQTLPWSGQ